MFMTSSILIIPHRNENTEASNSSSKTRGAAAPPHSNYLRVFLRFRRTFAEVITFGEASGHEF